MIPRRVYEHVTTHNWFAVAIDFIIVVVGVFVGLQAQEWNAARQDRSREAVYLASIARDVRSDIAEIDEIVRVSRVRMAALDVLLPAATGRDLPTGFASARGLIEIEKAPPFSEADHGSAGIALFILTTLEGNRAGYDTMINTGGISLVRDAALLREIHDYYATAASLRDFELSLKESRVALVGAEKEVGISPVDETPAAELANAFGADARLIAAAKNYWLYTNRHVKLMRDLRVKAEALLARLEGGSP